MTLILTVDDEPLYQRLVQANLAAEGYDVVTAGNGEQALEMIPAVNPDLVLLDVFMPRLYGITTCERIRAFSMVPIIMLTARGDEQDRVNGLNAGADDYIVKPFNLRELIARIRAALRRAYGELALSPETNTLNFGEIEIDLESMQVLRSGQPIILTPTEFRLLRLLVSAPGQVFSREQMIEAVWGYDSEIGSDRTVDVHMRHLREKMEEDPANPRWLLTARGFGYKFQP